MGARESLNGRKNVTRRKVNNGEKSPWGQCLTRPVPNGRRRSRFWLVPENFCVFLPNQKPERRRPFGTGLVRHCPQGIFSPFFTFLRAIFSRLFRLSLAPPLSASGSPRMFPGKIDNIPLPRVFSWSFSPATIEFQKSPVRPITTSKRPLRRLSNCVISLAQQRHACQVWQDLSTIN